MPEASKAKAKPNADKQPNPMPFMDPFTQMAPFVQDGFDRLHSLYEELAALEQTAYDRSKEMSAQLGEMVTGTLGYATQLAREWRHITLEATQRTATMFREKA